MTSAPEATAHTFQEALSFHRQGRLDKAAILYQAVLAADREHTESLLHLGVVRLQENRPEDSIALTLRALALNPTLAEAHCNLATAYQALRRHGEAIASYEEALAIDPDYAEAYYGLASALQSSKRYDEAIACYDRALTIDAEYAEAHFGCGTALQNMKRYEEAIDHYRKALETDPDYAEASYGLAAAFQALKRYEEAVPCYEKALGIAPGYPEIHLGLGVALQALNRHEEALARYREALAIRPAYAQAYANLGTTFEEIGMIEEACRAFDQAIAIEPSRPRFYFPLINARRVEEGDPNLAALEALASTKESFDSDDRIQFEFALGKAYQDLGQHERSFRHFFEGNDLKRQQIAYDEAAALQLFDSIPTVFTPALMRAGAGAGNPSRVPIFIVGMPRSGSTLIEQILASHPQVFANGERSDFSMAVSDLCSKSDPSISFPQSVLPLTGERLDRLATAYLTRVHKAAAARVTDKTPANFAFLGLINLALPNARVIHSRRNPIDTCLSCFSKLFTENNQPFSYDFGELGRYHRAYATLMTHWRNVLPQDVMLDVQYEELIDDFEPQARRLIAHCGLDWNDACLDFHKTERAIKTASTTQVRQPIYKSSVGRRRPSGALLKPLLDGLGESEPAAATLKPI